MKNAPSKCNRLVVLSSLAFLVGCSSFNQKWEQAAIATNPGDITGKWQGQWRSDKDDHTGSLKCVITKLDADRYCAHFKATYWKIFTFGYEAELTGKTDGEAVHLSGEEDLGALAGGIYKYDGSATNTNFNCTYSSKYDHGKFIMTRPTLAQKPECR